MPDSGKAAELRKLLEVPKDEKGRPKRLRSFFTYLSDPDRVVDVPLATPGDVVAAEEKFGEGLKPFHELVGLSKLKSWMIYRALSRHPDEAERPVVPFEDWLDTVDHLWDEEPDVGPLADRLAELVNRSPSPSSSEG